jgi:lipid-binding SYLF domain-containing protein
MLDLDRTMNAEIFRHRTRLLASLLHSAPGRTAGIPKLKKVRHMKKIVFVMGMVMCLAPLSQADQSRQDVDDRMQQAATVLRQVMGTPDKGIPEEVMDHAKCVAVVPHLIKGGFIFGAEGGRGVVTCRTDHGWSAPAFFDIEGGSWGLQIGVEGIDLVMIVQNDKGMQDLLQSKFQIGADASAAAGPVGRHASADTDWKMNAEILTYSRAKGIFAGLNLSGAAVHRDDDAMKAVYGPGVSTREVLDGKVPSTPGARPFLHAVHGAHAQARAAQ